ncbi:MAG: nuclear transport factor 2 family protein [Pseudomonadota bacterium]
MTKKEFLEEWFKRVWIEEDEAAIAELLQPKSQLEGLREIPQVGPEEFTPFVKALLAQVKVKQVTIKRCLEDDSWISALLALTLECRTSGTTIHHTGQVMARIEDGKIVEGYNHFDFISLYEGLGLLPKTTLALCLQGQRFSMTDTAA